MVNQIGNEKSQLILLANHYFFTFEMKFKG